MGGDQGSHPSNTGNKVVADAPRTSGSAHSHRPVSQDVFFSEACASTHQRPRLSTLLSPHPPGGSRTCPLSRGNTCGVGGWC